MFLRIKELLSVVGWLVVGSWCLLAEPPASITLAGEKYVLVWHDEFEGNRLDESKWNYRTNFWGRRAPWFAGPEDGAVEVSNGVCRLKLVTRADGQIVSPQLQTGSLLWDNPADPKATGFWPLGKREKAKFTQRYGYYECRCRLQQMPGWWSAFWMQSEMQGASLNPARAGVEHDIMESFEPGVVIPAAFHYNGYGPEYKGFTCPRGGRESEEKLKALSTTLDKAQFHTFGFLWEPDGYRLYIDGKQRGPKVGQRRDEAVSQVEEFLLITTEGKDFRQNKMTGKAVPELAAAAAAGDAFEVDYVRAYVHATPAVAAACEAVTAGGGDVTAVFRHVPGDSERVWLRPGDPACTVIEFALKPSAQSRVNARLVLPDEWDGRFWGIGNQDIGKDIADWLCDGWQMPRVRAGSAACCADMGTGDGRFGPEVVKDFGWRAHHVMAVAAKRMVAAFYGKKAAHSYFIGLSSGGGQGLHEAQRFPEDYEGIISYVPAHYRTGLARFARAFVPAVRGEKGARELTAADVKIVNDAAAAYFANRPDVFSDGIFQTVPDYTPEVGEGILDAAAKLDAIYKTPQMRARWLAIWQGNCGAMQGVNLTPHLGRVPFISRVLYGPQAKGVADMTDAEFETFIRAVEKDFDAANPDLSAFAKRGGKLILVSGLADAIVSCRSAWDYSRRVKETMGAAADDFFRAYFLPGRGHGGRAGAKGVGDIPSVKMLIDWCENGVAPAREPVGVQGFRSLGVMK